MTRTDKGQCEIAFKNLEILVMSLCLSSEAAGILNLLSFLTCSKTAMVVPTYIQERKTPFQRHLLT